MSGINWHEIHGRLVQIVNITTMLSASQGRFWRDNQGENPATIRMRMRRCWGDEGRAEPDRSYPSSGVDARRGLIWR